MPETTCVVPLCSNKGQHIFPKEKSRRDAWIQAIRRGKSKFDKWKPPSKYSYICQDHFNAEDYNSLTYYGTERVRRTLKKTAVPTKFSWTLPRDSPKIKARADRCHLREAKRRKLFHDSTNTTEEAVDFFIADMASEELGACETVEVEETLQSGEDLSTYEPIYTNSKTQTPKQPMFSIYNFDKDDEGIHYYTGLESYVKFFFVLQCLGPAAYYLNYVYHQVSNISVPDQFFIVLKKLRRHTPNIELSRLFGISESTVSNIFVTWIIFMYRQWKELDLWPPQEIVRYYTPSGFKRSFPNTRVIIDGTECPIKKPKNPTAQQATYSTYKNRNTVKVLVGSTPGGLVSYVSPAYGGATSDRQIVERSALLTMCNPKDSIMADKGFNVQDLFAPYDVQINIPTFFRKKNRMSGKSVLRDRKISSKRVHIERIIGLAKTYKILLQPMSATHTKLSTEIIFCCFMLCNFRNCIIPKYA